MADLDPEARSLEGYLYPETYQFTRTQSLKDMAGRHGEAVSTGRSADWAFGEVHRIVTMASIVEKETAVPEERPLVAGVYYNRLQRRGWR